MADKAGKKAKESKARWYRKNKVSQIERQKQERIDLRIWLTAHKKTLSCSSCGMTFKDFPVCCDFHHTDSSEKEGNIGELIIFGRIKLLRELKKCVPLCANCHRIEHFGNKC